MRLWCSRQYSSGTNCLMTPSLLDTRLQWKCFSFSSQIMMGRNRLYINDGFGTKIPKLAETTPQGPKSWVTRRKTGLPPKAEATAERNWQTNQIGANLAFCWHVQGFAGCLRQDPWDPNPGLGGANAATAWGEKQVWRSRPRQLRTNKSQKTKTNNRTKNNWKSGATLEAEAILDRRYKKRIKEAWPWALCALEYDAWYEKKGCNFAEEGENVVFVELSSLELELYYRGYH